MIDDESEPSLFRVFENNLSSNPSTSELTSTDTDSNEDQNTNLERKTSISLYNVSSTPHVFKPLKKCRFRTKSHFNIDSDYEYKPKRKKYDHIESKVKQYRNEIREQSEYRRTLRQQQEDEIRKELENNLKISDPYERKNHSHKFLPNVITNDDFKSNLSNLSPIVNISGNYCETIELKEKYNEALNEIENLQIEITKLKAAKSITPKLPRRKSLQSSMIKTCLFKNSSTAIKQNALQNNTRSSLFGADSTCYTFEVEDLMSPTLNAKKNGSEDEERNNPFIVKSPCPSPESVTNSSVPLLYYERSPRKRGVYNFLNNFIKCPTMGFLQKLKYEKKNKVAPIPSVVISSPNNHEKSKTESFEFIRKTYCDNQDYVNSPKQELLLKEMTDCCEELTKKINRFKKLVNDYLSKNNNNN